MYDAVIIGGGTAGMTAGIYLAGRGKIAVVLEKQLRRPDYKRS